MAEWTQAYINDLPDSAFAYIEPGGTQDDEGKTAPRSLRHFPHHNSGGSLDLPHLRNALGRGPQSDVWPHGEGHLQQHAKEAGVGDSAKSLMAVKFVDGSEDMIEGLAIPFGGPFAGKDLHGEAFDAETDFAFDWFPNGRPVIYDHGTDKTLKAAPTGRQVDQEIRDIGVWAKVQLDRSNAYFGAIKELVDRGKLFFSSGSVPHLVETTKEGKIKRWPWIELSLTPQPANPMAAVYAVKAATALDHLLSVDSDIPEPVEVALKALADWHSTDPDGDSEPETLTDQSERVLAGLKEWVERMEERSDFRAKSGRELSKANAETLREAQRIIAGLLERVDRPSEDEQRAEAAKAAYAEFLRLEAETLTA
jgi:hypothetical protein